VTSRSYEASPGSRVFCGVLAYAKLFCNGSCKRTSGLSQSTDRCGTSVRWVGGWCEMAASLRGQKPLNTEPEETTTPDTVYYTNFSNLLVPVSHKRIHTYIHTIMKGRMGVWVDEWLDRLHTHTHTERAWWAGRQIDVQMDASVGRMDERQTGR
jgi:hypothetical protein